MKTCIGVPIGNRMPARVIRARSAAKSMMLGDFGGGEARLAIDRCRNRIADNRLANFALHSAEGRDRIGKRRRRALDRVAGRGVALHDDRTHARAPGTPRREARCR